MRKIFVKLIVIFGIVLFNYVDVWGKDELDVSLVEIPPFCGERYETLVPDTLDLAERMNLAINGFTRCVGDPPANPFPKTKYTCNHFIAMNIFPPEVSRNVPLYGKYMLGLNLARIVSGSQENLHIDNDWRYGFLDWQQVNPIMYHVEEGRRFEWASFNFRREPEPSKSAWAAILKKAVARLNQVAVPYKDGAWIPYYTSPWSKLPGSGLLKGIPDDGLPDKKSGITSEEAIACLKDYKHDVKYQKPANSIGSAWTVQGLLAIYRATKDPDALDLAGKLTRYLRDHTNIIGPDGQLTLVYDYLWPGIHWHHNIYIPMACAEYGAASKDSEFLNFADKVYRHVLSFCSPETGFAPEYCYGQFPRKQTIDNTESCCSADLILLVLWLTQGGTMDYWDDIDRYIRNHIATLQLTDTRLFYNIPENRDKNWKYPDPEAENVYSKFVGHWAGWATPNEWHDPQFGPGIQTCCIGNCTRALYYVWEKMLDFSDGRFKVNLMLNRASQWADLNSYRPYEGKFEIKLKTDCQQVLVRAPEWIGTGSSEVTCTINGEPRILQWQGRYLDIGAGLSGQTYTISFPISVRKVKTEVGRQNFTLTIKGNTVVEMDPPGQRMPIYQRKHYLGNSAPIMNVKRYIDNIQ